MTDYPISLRPTRALLVTLQLIGVTLVCGFVLGVILAIWNISHGRSAPVGANLFLLGISNLAAFTIILRRECRIERTSFPALGRWSFKPVLLLVPLILMAIAASMLTSEISNGFNACFPQPAAIRRFFQGLGDLGNHPFGSFFCLVLVAPVTEELVFRGLILRGLLVTTKPLRALLISTAPVYRLGVTDSYSDNTGGNLTWTHAAEIAGFAPHFLLGLAPTEETKRSRNFKNDAGKIDRNTMTVDFRRKPGLRKYQPRLPAAQSR